MKNKKVFKDIFDDKFDMDDNYIQILNKIDNNKTGRSKKVLGLSFASLVLVVASIMIIIVNRNNHPTPTLSERLFAKDYSVLQGDYVNLLGEVITLDESGLRIDWPNAEFRGEPREYSDGSIIISMGDKGGITGWAMAIYVEGKEVSQYTGQTDITRIRISYGQGASGIDDVYTKMISGEVVEEPKIMNFPNLTATLNILEDIYIEKSTINDKEHYYISYPGLDTTGFFESDLYFNDDGTELSISILVLSGESCVPGGPTGSRAIFTVNVESEKLIYKEIKERHRCNGDIFKLDYTDDMLIKFAVDISKKLTAEETSNTTD